jgi:hypothetical protein
MFSDVDTTDRGFKIENTGNLWNLDGEKFHAQDSCIEGEAFVNIRAAESHLANQSLLT